ncbi:MAG: hypothetical protein KDI46_07585 [Alphaproteobacteria bacterium]|nr:hypothetical protein [Alphaproteobacteria bacterium]
MNNPAASSGASRHCEPPRQSPCEDGRRGNPESRFGALDCFVSFASSQ